VNSIRAARVIINFNCAFLINQLRVFTVHLTRVVPREVAGVYHSSPLADAEQIGGTIGVAALCAKKRVSEERLMFRNDNGTGTRPWSCFCRRATSFVDALSPRNLEIVRRQRRVISRVVVWGSRAARSLLLPLSLFLSLFRVVNQLLKILIQLGIRFVIRAVASARTLS